MRARHTWDIGAAMGRHGGLEARYWCSGVETEVYRIDVGMEAWRQVGWQARRRRADAEA